MSMSILDAFPRQSLGHFPTPLEPLIRLTNYLRERHTSVPSLWIKRDDCTGLATGGNKTRKLEYLVGDALDHGADILITQGATQSNHVRQTAAAAAVVGLECQLLIEEKHSGDAEYQLSGNVLLDELLGARIVGRFPSGTDMQAAMDELAKKLQGEGRNPYVIPVGGSTPIGALGYAACASELEHSPVSIDWVVQAAGSAGTQAGMLAGLQLMGSRTRVLGVSVRQGSMEHRKVIQELAQRTMNLCSTKDTVPLESVIVDDRWVGPGYGLPTESMVDAVRLLGRTEGILLDPVYSGKAFAGLLGNIAEGLFQQDENVVFLHTGGSAALFAYRSLFLT